MELQFHVYRNTFRINDNPCSSCKNVNCCSNFESAWGLMTSYIDEMRGNNIGTAWHSDEMQQLYDDAARQGTFGAIVTLPDGRTGCACIDCIDEMPE